VSWISYSSTPTAMRQWLDSHTGMPLTSNAEPALTNTSIRLYRGLLGASMDATYCLAEPVLVTWDTSSASDGSDRDS